MRTWISAGVYYASNFLSITKVVNALEDEASSIVAAKKLLESSDVKNDLTCIAAEFGFLPQLFCQLQERGQPLTKSVKIVGDAVQRLKTVPGKRGSLVGEKCMILINLETFQKSYRKTTNKMGR